MVKLFGFLFCLGFGFYFISSGILNHKSSDSLIIDSCSAFEALVLKSKEKWPMCYCDCFVLVKLDKKDVEKSLDFISNNKDYRSYCLLVSVNRYYPEDFKRIKNDDTIKVLCSALENSPHLNDWGHMAPGGSYNDEAAKILLECGKEAIPYLMPILDDDREAYLCGSEEATLSSIYHYRRKDFAFRYISILKGKKEVFKEDLLDRDRDIEILKSELAREYP